MQLGSSTSVVSYQPQLHTSSVNFTLTRKINFEPVLLSYSSVGYLNVLYRTITTVSIPHLYAYVATSRSPVSILLCHG